MLEKPHDPNPLVIAVRRHHRAIAGNEGRAIEVALEEGCDRGIRALPDNILVMLQQVREAVFEGLEVLGECGRACLAIRCSKGSLLLAIPLHPTL